MLDKSLLIVIILFLSIGSVLALEVNVSVPEEVEEGKWFDVNVSLKSNTSLNVTLYSYVYRGFNCVGQGWITNRQTVVLKPNVIQHVVLHDLIKNGVDEGYYKLRVKVKYDNETIVRTYPLRVVNGNFDIEPTYLYIGLVLVSLVGLYLVVRR
jgi:hypothetical protein